MKKIVILFCLFTLCGCTKNMKMPNFVGKSVDEVEAYAEKYHLKLKIENIYSNESKDIILKQDKKEKSVITEKDTITVWTSLGRLADETYQKYQVNELGNVPIMMYHGIHNKKNSETPYTGGNVDKDGYQRTTEAFRNDLEMYYQKGYRMIPLKEYIEGKINVELGKSPIILTFDDGLENNIKVTGLDDKGNLIIDPNSAVGILEEYKQKYKDFKVTATFFVNGSLFGQPEYNEKIMKWLIEHGYDIGNHTYTHPDFTKINEEEAKKEVGRVYSMLDHIIKGKYVFIVALPFGSPYKKTHATFSSIIKGSYENISYETKGALRVGWESNPSPYTKDFDPLFMKRIRAYDNNGKDFDILNNLNILEKNRYISDGNKNTITIPLSEKDKIVDTKKLEIVTYAS